MIIIKYLLQCHEKKNLHLRRIIQLENNAHKLPKTAKCTTFANKSLFNKHDYCLYNYFYQISMELYIFLQCIMSYNANRIINFTSLLLIFFKFKVSLIRVESEF